MSNRLVTISGDETNGTILENSVIQPKKMISFHDDVNTNCITITLTDIKNGTAMSAVAKRKMIPTWVNTPGK
ncbi:hypothetical protein KAJ61_03610 [Candidatus Parcubacteria bacterium]|nr:hypothetical protein [Candidatus Parcubacteria bacterium]